MKFVDKLRRLGACEERLAWVGDRTLNEAWAECRDPRWMIWYLGKAGTHKDVVRAGCACARTALQYVPEGEDRPLRAIETTEAWARGEATVEQVRDAARAAKDAAFAYALPALSPVALAAYACADVAAAAYFAYANAHTNIAAAFYIPGGAMCDIIREMWPVPPVRERRKATAR